MARRGHTGLQGLLSCSALEKIQPRAVSYEEQATAIREQLAQLLVEEEDFTKAAQTLAGIDLDSGKLLFPHLVGGPGSSTTFPHLLV